MSGVWQLRGRAADVELSGQDDQEELRRTSGRIQTETYGFALQENCPLVHAPNFDFLNGFSDQFSTQNSL